MVELLYSTGLRRSEAANLTLDGLDLGGGLVHVRLGKGGKDRVVPLGTHAAEWMRRYLQSARPALLGRAEESGRVFLSKRGKPLNGDPVTLLVKRWREAVGLSNPVTPQGLRRSCATEMIRAGANPAHVKDILGHEDFSSLAAYVKLAVVDLKEALKKFHPREAPRMDTGS
jgi:integrase/recombinase XerD